MQEHQASVFPGSNKAQNIALFSSNIEFRSDFRSEGNIISCLKTQQRSDVRSDKQFAVYFCSTRHD